jgi:hypothetical protein
VSQEFAMIANRIKPVLAVPSLSLALVLAMLAGSVLASSAQAVEPRRHHGSHDSHQASRSEFRGNNLSFPRHRQWARNDRWGHDDRWVRDNRPRRSDVARNDDRGHDRAIRRIGGDGFVSRTERSGSTWAGSTWAYSDPGNGIYFDRGYGSAQLEPSNRVPLASHMKIICVDQEGSSDRFVARNGCSYEEGVCVIRGGGS